MSAEWYYVGHYGELGPLTIEQMEELIRDGVVEKDTFVWRQGMSEWTQAVGHPDLNLHFHSQVLAPSMPPPPPVPVRTMAPITPHPQWYGQSWPVVEVPRSDRKRWIAGLLQLLIPGTGRMYLGYAAQGAVQLILFPFGCGIGWLWSVLDGIYILLGGLKMDGYGRTLDE